MGVGVDLGLGASRPGTEHTSEGSPGLSAAGCLLMQPSAVQHRWPPASAAAGLQTPPPCLWTLEGHRPQSSFCYHHVSVSVSSSVEQPLKPLFNPDPENSSTFTVMKVWEEQKQFQAKGSQTETSDVTDGGLEESSGGWRRWRLVPPVLMQENLPEGDSALIQTAATQSRSLLSGGSNRRGAASILLEL